MASRRAGITSTRGSSTRRSRSARPGSRTATSAKLAAAQGEENLAKICRKIAGDETRHETFYTRVIGEVMERDPEGGVLAYRTMLKGKIGMPGKLMFDGHDPDLYDHFGTVTQRNGAYTFKDYGEIISHLNEAWDIEHRSLSGKAAKAQDYICRQPERFNLLAGRGRRSTRRTAPQSLLLDPRTAGLTVGRGLDRCVCASHDGKPGRATSSPSPKILL